ncbi:MULTISPECIES: acyl-CoA dehydrogenase family protein [unclassified Variovorax]|uniref:acyl-CoA dehydrogenase family protein n=1 Tax=unclassified Variovorax TaxID=663243 RepID=UPI00076BFD5B|nr:MULTISPECIES: acyl-CoA dehydrogenase family protein [unclassified Variovorax]KWT98658.1 Acyl-CoA dehydrogenase [Variovorax sp. WDL1]PNG59385.1 putative acyl-CoA dehydrogenase AidB [Variovorax sp. B4]PNG60824.1 putative acyl-CoA dehydrogenase AidB [Variovorax sp. B2]VTV13257.1 Putative acyl-CoA dehydrogenase AidB [Variovorax sp. WDL1]
MTRAAEHPVPDRHGQNLYSTDAELLKLLPLYLPPALLAHMQPHFERLGALAGGPLDELAHTADINPPTLSQRTRTGLDEQKVIKHPAYVEMERLALSEFGLAAMSHREETLGWKGKMPPLVKYVLTYLFVQAEFGLCCPVSMTDSLARTLRKFGSPELVERFLPRFQSLDFDTLAQGAMFMTEQAAGSDIAATVTRAWKDDAGRWRLSGDKWFCSNPDADFAMVLARPDDSPAGMKGVSLFLLPRRLDDGTPNHYRIIRLKDKLGTRSMASGEIRLEGAIAHLVGEPGRGFQQMADMVNNSRLSNGVRAAGLMRRAVGEAEYIASQRRAFGQRLDQMPLMQRQLQKLRMPAEQARTMVFQTALALARSDGGDASAYPLLRILTPLIKFRACRDARKVTGDAMEVRGGCGYIEEWADPRLVRDAHLGSIWEGTSNIVALDVIRAVQRENSLPALQAHFGALLDEASIAPAFAAALRGALARAGDLAGKAAQEGGAVLARQAASALYHCCSAIAMAWEGARAGSAQRIGWAQAVLLHRVLPRDPLAAEAVPGEWTSAA